MRLLSLILLCLGLSYACTPKQAQDVQSAIDAGLVIAGDVCKVIGAVDNNNPPDWIQVACSVVNVAEPVTVTLPWSVWLTASTRTAKQLSTAKDVP